MRGQLLLGTGICHQVGSNRTAHYMLFYLGFDFHPLFITIIITFYFISITCPCFSPWVFLLPISLPIPPEQRGRKAAAWCLAANWG